jgi:hypothetical protein
MGKIFDFLQTNAPLVNAMSAVGSFCTALCTALIAIMTFYFVYLKPPKPFEAQGTFTTPTFENQDGRLGAALALAVTNSGGLPGKIEDLALRLRCTKNGRRWDLLPIFLLTFNPTIREQAKRII